MLDSRFVLNSRWAEDTRTLWRPGRAPMVEADTVLGGRQDAFALLLLRIVRTSSWLVLATGLIIAWVTGQATRLAELNTVAGLVDALRTPLVVVATGVVVRFLLTPAAWLLALVAMVRSEDTGGPPAGEGLTWTDVLRTADARRAVRWTLQVRHRAVEMLGAGGRLLVLTEIGARFATGIAFTVFVVLATS